MLTSPILLTSLEQPQFHILRKLSQDPVQHAMPSEDTPMQLTLLSWPASTPVPHRRRKSTTSNTSKILLISSAKFGLSSLFSTCTHPLSQLWGCPRCWRWSRHSQLATGAQRGMGPGRSPRTWCWSPGRWWAPGQHAGRTACSWHHLTPLSLRSHWGRTGGRRRDQRLGHVWAKTARAPTEKESSPQLHWYHSRGLQRSVCMCPPWCPTAWL